MWLLEFGAELGPGCRGLAAWMWLPGGDLSARPGLGYRDE